MEGACMTSQVLGPMVRFDTPCVNLGMGVPSVSLQMRLLRRGDAWTAILLVPAGKAPAAEGWIRSQADVVVHRAAGIAPRTLRCELRSLPPAWGPWMRAARVVQVDVASHGMATIFVQGTAQELAQLAASLGLPVGGGRARPSGPQPGGVVLTGRQMEVLRNAVAMGYYDVPHRISLRRLGLSMGLSVSAVSHLLRRAQGQIIRSYIDANALASGQALSDQEEARGQPPKGA